MRRSLSGGAGDSRVAISALTRGTGFDYVRERRPSVALVTQQHSMAGKEVHGMICRALRWLLCVGVAGLAFVQPGAAFAYSVGGGSTATGPTGVAAGVPFTFLATFIQPDGTPVPAGQTVTFSELSGPGTASVPPALLRIGGQWQRITLA